MVRSPPFGEMGQAGEQAERRVEGRINGQSQLYAGLLVPAPPGFRQALNPGNCRGTAFNVVLLRKGGLHGSAEPPSEAERSHLIPL